MEAQILAHIKTVYANTRSVHNQAQKTKITEDN